MFGVVNTRCPPWLQHAVDLRHHVHRVLGQVLHQFAAQHGGEVTRPRYGNRSLSASNRSTSHVNRSPSDRNGRTVIHFPRRPVIAARAPRRIPSFDRSDGVICRYAPISSMRSSGPPGGVISSVLIKPGQMRIDVLAAHGFGPALARIRPALRPSGSDRFRPAHGAAPLAAPFAALGNRLQKRRIPPRPPCAHEHSRSTHARARSPIACANAGRDTSRFRYSKNVVFFARPHRHFRQTSSGNSRSFRRR